ncbi:MAG: hypothetical protein IPI30_18750 [Saprospiraceae bacterium]|nr:hypothetical protein [Candidatus Vicinibacter affinis]
MIVTVAGGYTFPITKNFSICPNVFVDYIGGMGNGGTPDLSDRFYFNGRKISTSTTVKRSELIITSN